MILGPDQDGAHGDGVTDKGISAQILFLPIAHQGIICPLAVMTSVLFQRDRMTHRSMSFNKIHNHPP